MKELLFIIQEKREDMISLGLSKGLKNEDVIECSQQLDKMIATYQSWQKTNKVNKLLM